MNTSLLHFGGGLTLLVCLFFALELGAAQFVEVAAEVRIYYWGLQTNEPQTIHCVVGTNAWEMDGDFCGNCKATYWFTGHEIVEHSVVDRALSPQVLRELGGVGPPIGDESTSACGSVDGNPGLPRRVRRPDRLTLLGRIGWLAFCSGPCLKRDGREIFPPSDLWKELIWGDHFADQTIAFQDSLGLPKSLDLYTTNQPVVHYRVTASTNVLGWEFPTEFYLAQYRPAPLPGHPGVTMGTNGWELQFTARGKVNVIRAGTQPQIPPSVLKAARK